LICIIDLLLFNPMPLFYSLISENCSDEMIEFRTGEVE
jgi:hypothetical protein